MLFCPILPTQHLHFPRREFCSRVWAIARRGFDFHGTRVFLQETQVSIVGMATCNNLELYLYINTLSHLLSLSFSLLLLHLQPAGAIKTSSERQPWWWLLIIFTTNFFHHFPPPLPPPSTPPFQQQQQSQHHLLPPFPTKQPITFKTSPPSPPPPTPPFSPPTVPSSSPHHSLSNGL